jgi:hypothetical protein
MWPLVAGILKGMAEEYFGFTLGVELVASRHQGHDHEVRRMRAATMRTRARARACVCVRACVLTFVRACPWASVGERVPVLMGMCECM